MNKAPPISKKQKPLFLPGASEIRRTSGLKISQGRQPKGIIYKSVQMIKRKSNHPWYINQWNEVKKFLRSRGFLLSILICVVKPIGLHFITQFLEYLS